MYLCSVNNIVQNVMATWKRLIDLGIYLLYKYWYIWTVRMINLPVCGEKWSKGQPVLILWKKSVHLLDLDISHTGYHIVAVELYDATVTYKMLSTQQPTYLHNLISYHQSSRLLCSSSQSFLYVSRIKLTFDVVLSPLCFLLCCSTNLESCMYCYRSLTCLLYTSPSPRD